jgi:DNA/RNA endonuclease YhcR with UshA esterase domain
MRKNKLRHCIAAAILLFSSIAVFPQSTSLPTSEAKSHVGEKATVCGLVVDGRYAASTRGKPTFLNLDKPYPNQAFTIVIWGDNRAKFGAPEQEYRGKRVCVTGTISEYRGVPQIEASDPAQIMLAGK